MKVKKGKFKTKFKLILLSVLCLLVPFFIVACSPVTLTTKQNNNGIIQMSLEFDLSYLEQTGKTGKAVQIASLYTESLIDAYLSNFYTLFSVQYPDKLLGFNLPTTTQNEKLAIIFKDFPNFAIYPQDIPSEGENIMGEFKFVIRQENTAKVQISFFSIYAYILFFYPKAYTNDETGAVVLNSSEYGSLIDVPVTTVDYESQQKLFTTSIVQTCSPFSYNGEQAKLLEDMIVINGKSYQTGELLTDVIVGELNLNEQEAKYVYNFITPYSRVHSDGIKTNTEEGIVHTWDLGNDINGVIKLWRTSANQVAWYVLGIVLGTIIIVIGLIIILPKNKKKKETGIELLQKVDDLVRKREV